MIIQNLRSAMNTPSLFPVSERALTQRLNIILKKEGKRLVKSRSRGEISNMGDWYITDTSGNQVVDFYCKIEEMGREKGALMPNECFSDDF